MIYNLFQFCHFSTLFRFLPHSPTISDRKMTDQMTDLIRGLCTPKTGSASTHQNARQWQFVQQFSGSNDRPDEKNFSYTFNRVFPLVPYHQNWFRNVTTQRQEQQQMVQILSTYFITFKNVLL